MYDLRVLYPDGRVAAVEVTGAVDPDSTEFWNIMTGVGRWICEGLEGGWAVHVDPSARSVSRLREDLPGLLRTFEDAGTREYRPIQGYAKSRLELADELGITHAFQGGTDTPGSVYVYPEQPSDRVSGVVADTGDALADWLAGFLADPERGDVRSKLAASGADETHAFVIVPELTTAPFGVSDLLMRDEAPLPTFDPDLPLEVSHVWTVSTWSTGFGFRWSPSEGWSSFDKTVAQTDDPEHGRSS
jgi:hypothetical protein